MKKNMVAEYMHVQNAQDVLYGAASEIYKDKQFRDSKTQEVYQFISFMPGCMDGQVRAENLTKKKTEFLTYEKWFSLHTVGNEEVRRSRKYKK